MSEMKFIFDQVYTTLTKKIDVDPSKIQTRHPKRKLHITPMFGNNSCTNTESKQLLHLTPTFGVITCS